MESLKKHLKLIAKFPHYSQKNIQLITKQDTTVTKLASMNQWKEFGYELKENATPIYVQAPFYTIQKDEHGDPFLIKMAKFKQKKNIILCLYLMQTKSKIGKKKQKKL